MTRLEEIGLVIADSKNVEELKGIPIREQRQQTHPKGLAIQSEVISLPLLFSYFHSIYQEMFCPSLALSTTVVRWDYSHNNSGDHTRETQFGLLWNVKPLTNPPSLF